MLSSRDRLEARQGQSGTPRHEYLQQLVFEYARSQHWLRKEEIVANLANFAYDPINYAVLKRLRVMELFVEIISTYRDDGRHDQEDSADAQHLTREAKVARRRGDETASVVRSTRLLVEFAMGGICNCIPDPSLQLSFIDSGGVPAVLTYVEAIKMDATADVAGDEAATDQERRDREREKSVFNAALSALTTVYFLLDSPAFESVSTEAVMARITALGAHVDTRIANVALAYLARYTELQASVST